MILFCESVAGIAGDMCAASFVDAGLVTAAELQAIPALLGLEGVRIELTHPQKATMRATHVNVCWDNENWKRAISHDQASPQGAPRHDDQASPQGAPRQYEHAHGNHQAGAHTHSNLLNPKAPPQTHWHTHYLALDRFLERSRLEPEARAFAREVFKLLAEAEAAAHGMPLEEVAFHEVGAVDSVVDVAMVAYCVTKVGATRVLATAIKLGRGTITIEHGTQPVPPPATARLCVGMPVAPIPGAIERQNVELSTPTGLAILKALKPEFVDGVPPGTVRAQGMGAGTMDLGAYPNVFRLMLIEEVAQASALPYESDRVVELCCNVDDQTAERTAWVMEQLLARGALDVWATPLTGKKGRAAVCVSVLVTTEKRNEFADWILRHSSTFGVRYRDWDRLKLARRFEKRKTEHGELTFKLGLTTKGQVLKEKPEYEELRKSWDASLEKPGE